MARAEESVPDPGRCAPIPRVYPFVSAMEHQIQRPIGTLRAERGPRHAPPAPSDRWDLLDRCRPAGRMTTLDYLPRSPSCHRICKIRNAKSENGASARQAALNQMTNAVEPVAS